MRRVDVNAGDRFNDLTVLHEVESPGKRVFSCKCDCGRVKNVRLDHLRTGHTKSCGRCGILYKGKRQTIRKWASLYGLKESTLRARLKAGLDMREALGRK